MKSISAALKAIIEADVNHPLTVAVITLTDNTVLRVASTSVTIGGNAYQADLVKMPEIVVSQGSGIDHVVLTLNNADWQYSFYDNSDLFEGADVSVSQYFSDDGTFAGPSLVGPVLAFTGSITQPVTSGDGVISITVFADTRTLGGSKAVGRVITGTCMNTFRDANCGYSHSATILSGGTYPAQTAVTLAESLTADQDGAGSPVLFQSLTGSADRIFIMRGNPDPDVGTVVYGSTDDLHVFATDFHLGSNVVYFDKSITVQAGDYIVYQNCPRDSMFSCARRWQVGSASRQQDRFMGFDYYRGILEQFRGSVEKFAKSRYSDIVGGIVPILYGERWILPVQVGAHDDLRSSGDGTAWGSSEKGPVVISLISEGEIDTTGFDPGSHVDLDGVLLKDVPFYKGDPSAKVDLLSGVPAQTPSALAPRGNRESGKALYNTPGFAGLDNVAHVLVALPGDYDLGRGISVSGDTGKIESAFTAKLVHSFSKAGIKIKARGRKVYTWSFVAGVPTKSVATSYTENYVWHLLDIMTAPFRVADSDAFSSGTPESSLDMASFIKAADYAEETISTFEPDGTPVTLPRYESGIFMTQDDREEVISGVLEELRASLVPRNGKVGISLDAPMGGKGLVTSATPTSITDSERSNAANLAVPSWPTGAGSYGAHNGLLEGLKCKMLTGAAAVDAPKTIVSNTKDQVVLNSAWSVTPSAGDQYVIYAAELNTSNSGNVTRSKERPSSDLPNKVVVTFESQNDDHRGASGSVPIIDDQVDGAGKTHRQRFGLVEENVSLPYTVTWQQAVRHGWYVMRKAHDENRIVQIDDVNLEGMPLEVGDLALLTHDIDGVQNELFRVTKIEDLGMVNFRVTARLYREHIHADFPTSGDFDGISIASTLPAPNDIPPHVENMAHVVSQEDLGEPPLVTITYDLPRWPYAGWHVLLEARHDLGGGSWGPWRQVAVSRTSTTSFRTAKVATYEVRAVFVSHLGVRADASYYEGTVASATATTLVDTAANWNTDGFVDLEAEITAGTALGEQSTISANTQTELTVNPAWNITPAPTDLFRIFEDGPVLAINVNEGTLENLSAEFWSEPGSIAGTVGLFLRIHGPLSLFPVTADIYQGAPTGAPLLTHVFTAPGDDIGPTGSGMGTTYAALTDIVLPDVGAEKWWVRLTDDFGAQEWAAFLMADRDVDPGGVVVPIDFKPDAQLACRYDDDVAQIVVSTPSGDKTFSGLSGGGSVTYTVGDALDIPPAESLLNPGEERSGYTVTYTGGGVSKIMWEGALHGANVGANIAARLRVEVNVSAGTADLFLFAEGDAGEFPASADIYDDNPTTPPIQSHTFTASGQEVGPGTYATLDNIPLPKFGENRWYAKITGANGAIAWTETSADRNKLPGGSVTLDDQEEQPIFYMRYDDDVSQIVVSTPIGIKTYSGLSGGGVEQYQIGVTQLDSLSTESDMDFEEVRGPYVITYTGGATSIEMFDGSVRGPVKPAITVELDVDERSGRWYATVNKKTQSTESYRFTIAVGAIGSSSHPAIDFGPSITTHPTYVGTVFGARVEIDAAADLVSGQAGFISAQGFNTASTVGATQQAARASEIVKSSVSLGIKKGSSVVEDVDLVFDESTDTLTLSARSGELMLSARLEIDDNSAFSSPDTTDQNVSGGAVSHSVAIGPGDRNKTWYGRVTPYDAVGGGAGAGVAGNPKIDSEFVPSVSIGGPEEGLYCSIGDVTIRSFKAGTYKIVATVTFGDAVASLKFEPGNSGTVKGNVSDIVNVTGPGTVTVQLDSMVIDPGETGNEFDVTPFDGAGATGSSGTLQTWAQTGTDTEEVAHGISFERSDTSARLNTSRMRLGSRAAGDTPVTQGAVLPGADGVVEITIPAIYRQALEPDNWIDGDTWIKT